MLIQSIAGLEQFLRLVQAGLQILLAYPLLLSLYISALGVLSASPSSHLPNLFFVPHLVFLEGPPPPSRLHRQEISGRPGDAEGAAPASLSAAATFAASASWKTFTPLAGSIWPSQPRRPATDTTWPRVRGGRRRRRAKVEAYLGIFSAPSTAYTSSTDLNIYIGQAQDHD